MTEYAPRNSQDLNSMYPNNQLPVTHYSNGNGMNYLNGNGQIHYSTIPPAYPTYSAPYVPSQNSAANLMYMPSPTSIAMPYDMPVPRNSTLPSQPRALQHHSYYASNPPSYRNVQQPNRFAMTSDIALAETEDQESPNEDSMKSEPVHPPLEGYPEVGRFDDLMRTYVRNLSPKKQDKALIHAKRAANIKAVLIDKKTTSVESAQFRFWVKKMFSLLPNDPSIPAKRKKICHEGKPVAVREKLFKILTKAHKQCQHGGRDKTSAQVRKHYSWVPKELISRFVKLCPTCQTPDMASPTISRRSSVATNHSAPMQSPLQMAGFSKTFQQQNRWMTSAQESDMAQNRMSADHGNMGSPFESINSVVLSPAQDGRSHMRHIASYRGSSRSSAPLRSSSRGLELFNNGYHTDSMAAMHDMVSTDMRYENMKQEHDCEQDRHY